MKTKVLITQEIDLITLEVQAPIRYWEDSVINGVNDTENGDYVPCKINGIWCPIIDIDTGIIRNWRQGTVASIHYKVVDEGSYYLKDKDGTTFLSIEENYVPKILCPSDEGYGDYIIMNINENGKIDNWKINFASFESENQTIYL